MNLQSKQHVRLLKAFKKHIVKFLIIGGHASIYHGVRRSTSDLDILVEPSRVNGARVIEALNSLGLEVPEIDPKEFETNLALGFGFDPDSVDIINFTPGLDFKKVYNNSVNANFEGVEVQLIDIRDLITNKQSLKRSGEKSLIDQYDVEVLKKIIERKKQ